jgi:Holliday junction resolvase
VVNGRNKGKVGERDVVQILKKYGVESSRNLSQTRGGGHDLIIEDGPLSEFAIEVKRAKDWTPGKHESWVEQAIEQAGKANKKPLLVWRTDRNPWFVEYVVGQDMRIDYFHIWLGRYLYEAGILR